MGQNRTDTQNQLAAKQRVAEKRRCPKCSRRSALSTPIEVGGSTWTAPLARLRTCLYCGHEVLRGRDVEAARRLLDDLADNGGES